MFFDADDTLYDYPQAERAALEACLDEFHIAVDRPTFSAAYHRHNLAVWKEYEGGRIDQVALRVERFRRLFAELKISGLPLERVSSFYLEALACQSQLLPGALELVRELAAKIPLALITNGIAAVQNRRFAASPITRFFKSIVISEQVGIAKPDPRIFAPALQTIGIAAADVLYVGDSVSSDMAAARNAGMDFCWVNPAALPVPHGEAPLWTIGSIAELGSRLGL